MKGHYALENPRGLALGRHEVSSTYRVIGRSGDLGVSGFGIYGFRVVGVQMLAGIRWPDTHYPKL